MGTHSIMLKEEIQGDLNGALKKREELRALVLRTLLAAILNQEKEKRAKLAKAEPELNEEGLIVRSQLTDEEVIEVISSEIKKRKEATLEFEKGKRGDLVKKEKAEMEILQKYLPEQLSEEEIKKLAKQIIEKVGAKEPKDYNPPTTLQGKNIYGKVMGELMPKVKGKADGSLVSKIVKELLTSKNE